MENVNTFHGTEHNLGEIIELDETYEQIATPAGFKKIQLYPHQATVVKAMLDIENKRILQVKTDRFLSISTDTVIVETSAMVLSEPFGSGKTFEILALIMTSPIPRPVAECENCIMRFEDSKHKFLTRAGKDTFRFNHEVTRKFIGPDALLRPNLIVVGPSVLSQWELDIQTYTNLKVFCIGNYHSLVKFYELYKQKKLKVFDIILLKNGTVTGNFVLPDEKPEDKKDHRSLVTVVGKITMGACWSRVIYDDFDTIKISSDAKCINALFTIYVSATTKTAIAHKPKFTVYATIEEAINSCYIPLNNILNDAVLFATFNVRNTMKYVEESTNIPIIAKFKCVFDNPDDNYIRLLGVMGEEDADNIMEMLNGDAIATAAEAMGLKTNSVADIFKRMLDKKYELYIRDQYILDTIALVRQHMVGLNTYEDKKYTVPELDIIRNLITKKIVPTDKLKFCSLELRQMIDEMHTTYTLSHEQHGLAIRRVTDNIKEGSCQVCALPLEGTNAFIVKCCGLIVCDVCGIKGNQITKRYDNKTKSVTLVGSCANCKAIIYPQIDLIFVDADFDMDALLEAKGDEMPAELIVEEVNDEVNNEVDGEVNDEEIPDPIKEIKNPKLRALLQIINSKTPENTVKVNMTIPHLLEGRVDKPQDSNTKKKVIIFANYNETLHLIESFLREQNIEFLRLSGTYKELADTVERFKHFGKVLLINSHQHCAGLNIQFASDAVLFHHFVDPYTVAQICGRAQRIERESNLNLYMLLYRNETHFIE